MTSMMIEEIIKLQLWYLLLKRSENVKADALSWRSDYIKDKSQTIQSVLSLQQNEIIIYNMQTITATMIIINNRLEDTI